MTSHKQHRIHPEIRARARKLRQPQTPAETKLWAKLRNNQLDGLKFRRQHAIGQFIVDFYCASQHLVIEIDGDSHADQEEYDNLRTEWLNQHGYRVIRFANRQVEHELEAVLEVILAECRKEE